MTFVFMMEYRHRYLAPQVNNTTSVIYALVAAFDLLRIRQN